MRKAVELTSGGLPLVRDTGLRIGQPVLTGRQKSAEGIVVKIARESGKERRPERSCESRLMGVASKRRDS